MPELRTMLRRIARTLDAQRDVLTVSQVARLLQVSDADARAWCDRHGVVLEVEGRQRVLRSDVLEALRQQSATVRGDAPPARRRKGRGSLDSWSSIAARVAS